MNDYLILYRDSAGEIALAGSEETLAAARDIVTVQPTGTYFITRIIGSYDIKRETIEKVSIDYHPTTTRTRKVKA